MKTGRGLFHPLLILVLGSSTAFGQDTSASSYLKYHSLRDTVKTGDRLDDTHYYLKVAPPDTTRKDLIPVVPQTEYQEVDVQPIPVNQVPPEYSEEAKRLKIEGTVWVKCLVSKSGSVKKVEVVKADVEMLIKPAVDAAKQWKFTPALLGGKPVETWVAIPFRFRLEK